MPSVKQNASIDRSRLVRVQSPQAAPVQGKPTPAPPPASWAMSPFFVCSMPPVAAGSDQYMRQFYGSAAVPQARILPVKS